MWMRIDNKFDDVLQFDNMNNRPITGTTNWNRYEIILDVPLQSAAISFGIILSGRGQVWADQLAFEEVDKSVEITNMEIYQDLLEEPIS